MKRLRYKKNICLVTSSRADYDLMSKLINLFKRDNRINFTLLITGQHLSKKYGYTYKSIIKKHRKNSKKIDIKVNKANKLSILNSMSNVLKDVGKYLYSKKIDLLVVLGDRYETTSSWNDKGIYHSTTKYETLDAYRNRFSLTLLSPKTSLNAIVSPGESGSFNSSKPRTLPLTKYGLTNSKHFLVGSYKSKSKYTSASIVSGCEPRYFSTSTVASPGINSNFLMCDKGLPFS